MLVESGGVKMKARDLVIIGGGTDGLVIASVAATTENRAYVNEI